MKPLVQKGLLLMALLSIEFLSCLAQSSMLKGRIYSAESFNNISHANVVIKNGEGLIVTSITTGYDGRYETDSIEPGAYRLEISSKDFEDVQMNNIYLQSGKVANVDIAMNSSEEVEPDIIRTSEKEKNDTGLLDILGGIFKSQLTGGF